MCGQDETQENARRVALAPHFAVLPDGKGCDDQGDQRRENNGRCTHVVFHGCAADNVSTPKYANGDIAAAWAV